MFAAETAPGRRGRKAVSRASIQSANAEADDWDVCGSLVTNSEFHELVLVANSAGDVVIWLIVVGAPAQLFRRIFSQAADDGENIKVVVLRVIRIQNPIVSATPLQCQRNKTIDVVTHLLQERDGLAVKLRIFFDVLIVPSTQPVDQIWTLL